MVDPLRFGITLNRMPKKSCKNAKSRRKFLTNDYDNSRQIIS